MLGLLITLGVSFVIGGLLVWRYPIGALSLNIGGGAVPMFGVRMRRGSLLATAITLAAGGALILFLRTSSLGRAVRSVIQDEEGSILVGINPESVRSFIFALSGVLAGLVAITRSMTSPVTVTAGLDLTILALIVTVVGGLGSVTGALLAGIILGIVNTVSSFYVGQYITSIVLLSAAALTIVLRPVRSSRSSTMKVIVIVAAALALVPIWVGDSRFLMGLVISGLLFACYGVAFNLIFGETKQLFLCVGSLAGVGGYLSALLSDRAGLPFPFGHPRRWPGSRPTWGHVQLGCRTEVSRHHLHRHRHPGLLTLVRQLGTRPEGL